MFHAILCRVLLVQIPTFRLSHEDSVLARCASLMTLGPGSPVGGSGEYLYLPIIRIHSRSETPARPQAPTARGRPCSECAVGDARVERKLHLASPRSADPAGCSRSCLTFAAVLVRVARQR